MTPSLRLALLTACLTGCLIEKNVGNSSGTSGPDGFATPRWALTLGGPGYDKAIRGAVDSAGNLIAGGFFQQTVDFGDVTATAANYGGWLSKRASADGHALWTITLGTDADSSVTITGVAIGPNDTIVVSGVYQGTISIGPHVLQGPPLNTTQSSFVAEYDTNGNVLWVTSLDGWYQDVAVGEDGHVAALSDFVGTLQFPNESVSSQWQFIAVAVLDANGALQWGHAGTTQGGAFVGATAIAMSPEDDVVISGDITQDMLLADYTLVHPAAPGVPAEFVARFDIAGDLLWTKMLDDPELNYAPGGIALGLNGGVVAAATVKDTSTSPNNGLPAFTALDPNGAVVWNQQAVAGSAVVEALASLSSGAVISAGNIFGFSINFGQGPLTTCFYLAKNDASGAFSGAQGYGDPANCVVADVASLVPTVSGFALAGDVQGPIDLGTGTLRYAGGLEDIMLAMYDVD